MTVTVTHIYKCRRGKLAHRFVKSFRDIVLLLYKNDDSDVYLLMWHYIVNMDNHSENNVRLTTKISVYVKLSIWIIKEKKLYLRVCRWSRSRPRSRARAQDFILATHPHWIPQGKWTSNANKGRTQGYYHGHVFKGHVTRHIIGSDE